MKFLHKNAEVRKYLQNVDSRGKDALWVTSGDIKWRFLIEIPVSLIARRGKLIEIHRENYFPKVNLAVKPMAAGSKFISLTMFNSGFQSKERLSGMLTNL